MYYVHGLKGLYGVLTYRSKPTRYLLIAKIKQWWFVNNHPWGEAVITKSPKPPEIIR